MTAGGDPGRMLAGCVPSRSTPLPSARSTCFARRLILATGLILLLAGCQGDGLLADLTGEASEPGGEASTEAASERGGDAPDRDAASGDGDRADLPPALGRKEESPLVAGAGPIILRQHDGDEIREKRPVSPEEAGWEEKYKLAKRYAGAGYDDQALALIEASLASGVGTSWRGRFKSLAETIRMRRTQEHYLRVEVRPSRDYLVFGEGVDIEVRILNVSRERIVMASPSDRDRGVSPSALTLDLVRRDWDIFGSFLSRSWGRTIFLHDDKQDIVIEPGATHRLRARIQPQDLGGTIRGFRVLEIGGVLRPTRVRIGERERAFRVPLRGARVVLLPRNYEPLATRPLESFETALETRAADHLMVAAWFLAPGQVETAYTSLRRQLISGPLGFQRTVLATVGLLAHRMHGRPLAPYAQPLLDTLASPALSADRAQVLMKALALLAGTDVGPRPALWLDWWRREQAREPVIVDPTARMPSRGPGGR